MREYNKTLQKKVDDRLEAGKIQAIGVQLQST